MHVLGTGIIRKDNLYLCFKNFSIESIYKSKANVLREIQRDQGDPICMHAFLKVYHTHTKKNFYTLENGLFFIGRIKQREKLSTAPTLYLKIYEETYFDELSAKILLPY